MSDRTDPSAANRREFLTQVGGAAVAIAGASSLLPGLSVASASAQESHAAARQRASDAYKVRRESAVFHKNQPLAVNVTNGDEERYANKIGSYSKLLKHNENGEVLPESFASLTHAMSTGAPADFEDIQLGGAAKLANPQSGFAFTFCGSDTQATAVPTPPAFASAEQAAEMVEVYWGAMTRDVPFAAYAIDATVAAAATGLSALTDFRGPKVGGTVTPATFMRSSIAGALIGPYVSQLLWKPINYGPYVVDQKVRVVSQGVEYLTDYNIWLGVQNGGAPVAQQFAIPATRRYIINGRDLTEWLHRDFSHQGGTNAVFILGASGVGLAPGNPYLASVTQNGNFTLGQSQILDLVAAVANASLQACWYHKWSVHRRVRPEEFAGSIRNKLVLGLPRPIHNQVLGSQALARVLTNFGSALLPMPYPEGCPVHSAYPAGDATFAGAWCTVLKAFFNNGAVMT